MVLHNLAHVEDKAEGRILRVVTMPCSLDDYEVLGTIGSGSYGTCKKIKKKKDGKILVWKELDYGSMSETEKQMLVSEVNLLRELKHQHIVRYYDRIIDRSTTTLYIIMEYCEGGDLSTYITRLKKEGRTCEEAFVWKICHQVVSALKECHCRSKNGKAVLHRDLKPANVFLDNQRNVKLGDFGLARVLNHETSFAKTFVGTPYYMSPEQMNYMSYNEKSDVWSLGCMLYELCALRPPFTASNQRELATRICGGHFQRIPARYSDDLNEMIAVMLQVEEYKRPSIDRLLDHPLLLKHGPREKLSCKRSSVDTTESAYIAKLELLKRREEHISEQEKQLIERETKLLERDRELLSRERKVTEREQQVKLRDQELDNREKTIALREKMTDDRLARVEKLLDSPRPRLESTRKPSPRLPSPERLRKDEPEPGEIPHLELSDSGTLTSTFIAGRTTASPCQLAKNIGKISPLATRNSLQSHKNSHVGQGTKCKLAMQAGGLRDITKDNHNKENLTPRRGGYLASASPDRWLVTSPSLKMRLLGSPVLDPRTSHSPKYTRPVSASPRLHRQHSLKDDNSFSEARQGTSMSPRRCATVGDELDPHCVLKDRVLRMLRKSPPDLYRARKERLALKPIQKRDS